MLVAHTANAQDFNSIKVRLNPSAARHRVPVPQFQFHKGTIKPNCRQTGTNHLDQISIP